MRLIVLILLGQMYGKLIHYVIINKSRLTVVSRMAKESRVRNYCESIYMNN